MVPNGSAYANYPSFANNGTKTPPGGSTESAKYALGMVPADTFPAEWANWLFHGATAGITRLNADVGSIKKEINSLLAAYNITPDASVFNQLYLAIEKRISSLYPVGTIYQNADSNKNPGDSDMLGFGTWEPITDKFLAARGTTNIGASGGVWSHKLTEENIPQHNHGGNTGGAQAVITSAFENEHTHYFNATHAHGISDPGHTHTLGWDSNTPMDGAIPYVNLTNGNGTAPITGSATKYFLGAIAQSSLTGITIQERSITGYTGVQTDNHVTITQNDHSHTIGNYGQANPTAISITPTYVGVYTWKRTV